MGSFPHPAPLLSGAERVAENDRIAEPGGNGIEARPADLIHVDLMITWVARNIADFSGCGVVIVNPSAARAAAPRSSE